MSDFNRDEIMSSAMELVDKVKEAYDNGDMENASRNYDAIYELICPKDAPNTDERFETLNEVINNLDDEIIYAMTDYSKSQFTERLDQVQSLSKDIVYENDLIRISETGRDDPVAIIENMTYDDVVIFIDGEEFKTIECDDFIELSNSEYDKLNDCLSYSELEVKTVDELNERGYDRDDYDYDDR